MLAGGLSFRDMSESVALQPYFSLGKARIIFLLYAGMTLLVGILVGLETRNHHWTAVLGWSVMLIALGTFDAFNFRALTGVAQTGRFAAAGQRLLFVVLLNALFAGCCALAMLPVHGTTDRFRFRMLVGSALVQLACGIWVWRARGTSLGPGG